VVKIALRDAGFNVDSYNDPVIAVSDFKPNFYSLLLLNIKMPNMNGFELYEKVKKIDDKVKVCFLTGFGEQYAQEFSKGLTSSVNDNSNIYSISNYGIVALDELVKKVNEMI
jgi:DNA-binding response OmpR family regulator